MTITQLKRQAKATLKGSWGIAILLTLLIFLVSVIVPMILEMIFSGGFYTWSERSSNSAESNLFEFLFTLISYPFSVGVSWFYLEYVRKNPKRISYAFENYKDGKKSLKLVGALLLQYIYLFLWALLLLIPMFIKSISYSQTFYLLKDHPEYTVTEAISESRKRMKGYKRKYFLLQLSFVGWAILCIFTLGIGLLWFIPYVYTTNAAFYNELIYPQDNDDLIAKERL